METGHQEVDFELLYSAYSLNVNYRIQLDDRKLLDSFCQTAEIERVETFGEFAKAYDRKYLTKRCLDNHSPSDCLRYFSRQGDPEGFVAAVALGGNSWDESLREICKNKRYHLVPIFFSAIPEKREREFSTKISRFAAKDMFMFRCAKAHRVLDVRSCFVESCRLNAISIVMECLKIENIVHEAGLLAAASGGHHFLFRHLLSCGGVMTPKVRRAIK